MAEPRGMGRGLAAILPEPGLRSEVVELPIESLAPNPDQPRSNFDQAGLDALADSIADSGVVQPVIATRLSDGSYELIAGERRWRAAGIAGLKTIPTVIRDPAEAERLELALVENMVREDLNPVEEARACAALIEELGLSKEDLGRKIGRSRSQVSNLVRLLDLPDEAIALLEEGRLTEGHGRAILQAPDHEARKELAGRAAREGWTVRRTEDEARALSGKADPKAAPGRKGFTAEEAKRAEALAAGLETRFDRPVRIRPKAGGAVVEITLTDLADAGRLADDLDSRQ
ncbi:MAG: ParB/RepB/Spo0J family partition protein [Solirubrobacterales bacterium]